jgi:hypothetical protein
MHRMCFVVLSLFAANVFAQEAAPPAEQPAKAEKDNSGLRAKIGFAYSSPNAVYDHEGKKTDFPDGLVDSRTLIALGIAYRFGFGLQLGIDIPIVSHKQDIVIQENSNAGVGDVALHAGYFMPIMEMLDLGFRARLKVASGENNTGDLDDTNDDKPDLGNGVANAQLSVLANANVMGVLIDGELGYLITFTRLTGATTSLNQGDAPYLELAVGYEIMEMITPRVRFMFLSQGDAEAHDDGDPFTGGGASDTTIKDSGSQWLAVAVDADVKINDMLTAVVGWGTPLDAYGLNLNYGYVISGKNTLAGMAAFHAGVKLQL